MNEEIIRRLREKGCKITPQRRAVIDALINLPQFPTALDILNYVRSANPDVGLDTVYRNLNLLMDMGIVNQINLTGKDGKVFELALSGHHHHSICLGCGEAKCLDYCPVDEKDLRKSAGPNFHIVGHSFEIYGYCQKCGPK